MKHAIITKLVSENKLSHKIQVVKMDGGFETDRFTIPVVDVRDGKAGRGYVNTSIKSSAKPSKYIYPSFSVIGKSYQSSHKKEP